jgi:hypothetical protein
MSDMTDKELADMTRELWRRMDDDFADVWTQAIRDHNEKSGAHIIESIKKSQEGSKTKAEPAAECDEA